MQSYFDSGMDFEAIGRLGPRPTAQEASRSAAAPHHDRLGHPDGVKRAEEPVDAGAPQALAVAVPSVLVLRGEAARAVGERDVVGGAVAEAPAHARSQRDRQVGADEALADEDDGVALVALAAARRLRDPVRAAVAVEARERDRDGGRPRASVVGEALVVEVARQ